MIFQRGNPLDYRALGGTIPGWRPGTTRTACRTSSGWRPASRPRRRPVPGHDGPLVLERGPATNPLFTAFFAATPAGRLHLTDDVNGYRQEGFAPFDRNIHRGRRLSAARGVPASRAEPPEPRRAHAGAGHAGRCSRAGARSASSIARQGAARADRGRRDHPLRRRDQHAAAAPALGRRAAPATSGRSASRSLHDLPGVGENLQDHLEVYIQYACTSRSRCSRRDAQQWRRPFIGAQWLFLRSGPGRDEPLRGRRVRALERGRGSTRT